MLLLLKGSLNLYKSRIILSKIKRYKNKVRRDMSEKQKYIDFEAYERVAEPHKRERVSAWRTAIGLQDVDGLRVSDYLKNDIC